MLVRFAQRFDELCDFPFWVGIEASLVRHFAVF